MLPQSWKKFCFLVIIAHQYFQFFFSFVRRSLPLPGCKPKIWKNLIYRPTAAETKPAVLRVGR